MDKHTAVRSRVDNHSDWKERVIDMGKHSNEPQKHPAERKEPGGKEHGPDFHTKFESRNNYFRLTESRSAAARCQGRAWADDADVLCLDCGAGHTPRGFVKIHGPVHPERADFAVLHWTPVRLILKNKANHNFPGV